MRRMVSTFGEASRPRAFGRRHGRHEQRAPELLIFRWQDLVKAAGPPFKLNRSRTDRDGPSESGACIIRSIVSGSQRG